MHPSGLKFSANLGFLWHNLPLPLAIQAAADAGFDAVECHWPYDTPLRDIQLALAKAGIPMIGLNTAPGDMTQGHFGLAALPQYQGQARTAIDQAISYADGLGGAIVHVMAGNASGAVAHDVFVENLMYACTSAPQLTFVIEPLNAFDAPHYFLRNLQQAVDIIHKVNTPNLKLMFDCYHVALTEGDVLGKLIEFHAHIGHIQIASVPDRRAPDHGTVDYTDVFAAITQLGWKRPIGAEYKGQSLGWLSQAAPVP